MPFKLEEFRIPDKVSENVCLQSLLVHLIAHIGLEKIKQTVQENKPMPSLLGDPRKKGFQDGKFETATLEALLSLEDNFDKLTSEEVNAACDVSISSFALGLWVLMTKKRPDCNCSNKIV
jgi:hypothetical protein